ncbi:TPA: hypothetical protein I7E55_001810 [Vibrio cholerae]|nr:hypothetical protein [Vibrio cholerae]
MCNVNRSNSKAVLISQMLDYSNNYEILFYGVSRSEIESLGCSLKNLSDEQAYKIASNISERYGFDLVWNCPKPSWATKPFNGKKSHVPLKRASSNQPVLASAF